MSDFLKVVRFCWKFALWVIWWCWIHFWCYFDPKKLLWSPYIKCESLCKQSQKTMKECSHGFRTKATLGNVDMGNSTVPISSLGNVRKCEKMWDPYVNKPKNQWKAHRVDSRRSLPLVKSIWALQWCHFRVLKNVRNVRILCKQTQKSMKGSSYGLQTKPTPSKVDMGSSMVSFSISRKCEKCENLM